jgi:DNA polymerase-3 subunit epsilon
MTTLDQAVEQVSLSSDYRLLRRIPPIERWSLPAAEPETVRGVIVDCETTGLDLEADEVIELGIVPFDYEKSSGRVVRVHSEMMLGAFREPAIPITEESTRIHGITSAMVAAKVISPGQVHTVIGDAQIVIAHHASFDRPMLEKHWPEFENKCFGCSFSDIDWRAEGLSSSKLDYLLMRQGWFHDGHRALEDALATLFLLTMPMPVSRLPALGGLLERARKPLTLIRALETSIDNRGALKARGYRWFPGGVGLPKAWVLATNDPETEVTWLKASVAWMPRSQVALRAVPARLRYSGRIESAA